MTHSGRFAPSPTGDLHLGGARTALVAWLAARSVGGRFVLRIEDLDRPRVVDGAEGRIVDDLRWLGLDWDSLARQSERLDFYRVALDRLLAGGQAYACVCSRAEIARQVSVASAPHQPSDDGPRYPGTCRDRGLPTAKASIRLRVDLEPGPGPGTVSFVDAIAGPQSEDVAARVGDFVLRRADGIVAYQLAVVVDDAAMGIDEVVRGDDLLGSTARQIALYHALGFAPPGFAHVPLVLGPDGVRLAKRHNAPSVRALREAGVSAERVIGVLAHSLGLTDAQEIPARDLVADFSHARITRAPWVVLPGAFE